MSSNGSEQLAKEISTCFGIQLANDLGKYLGMSFIHGRVISNTFKFILDKVYGSLTGWKNKYLSMTGKLTLINWITSSIPGYAMQTTALPKFICDSID